MKLETSGERYAAAYGVLSATADIVQSSLTFIRKCDRVDLKNIFIEQLMDEVAEMVRKAEECVEPEGETK